MPAIPGAVAWTLTLGEPAIRNRRLPTFARRANNSLAQLARLSLEF
jgi:hypothetical protein